MNKLKLFLKELNKKKVVWIYVCVSICISLLVAVIGFIFAIYAAAVSNGNGAIAFFSTFFSCILAALANLLLAALVAVFLFSIIEISENLKDINHKTPDSNKSKENNNEEETINN